MLVQYDAVLPDDARLVLSHNYEVRSTLFSLEARYIHALYRWQTSAASLPLHLC